MKVSYVRSVPAYSCFSSARGSENDVTIDIRLILLEGPLHEMQFMNGGAGVGRDLVFRQS